MTKYAKTVRRTNPTYTAKFSGRSARGEDTYVVDRDGRFFAEGPVRALFVSYMRSPEWDAISAALGTAGADVRGELRKKLTNYEVHPNLLGPVAEQRVPEGYLRAGRRTPVSRTAKANPASERTHSVPELLMAVQDLVLWARGIGPATSRTRYYLRAASYPKGGDRAFWLGEALDEVKRDAQHDPRVASHVAYMLKEYPGARVNPARTAGPFRRSPYGGSVVTRDGIDWHVLPVKRGAPSSYASTAHWQASKGGSWQVVAVPAGAPVGGYHQQAWPFNDGATARAAALSLPAPAFTRANPAKARSARSARGGKRKPFQVQSYEFDKSSFTEARAKAWLKQHGYRSAIDEGPEFYHARQHSPSDYQKGTLHTIAIAKHVQAIVGIPKRGSDASEASGYGARGPRQGRLFGAKGAKGARGAAPVYDDEVPF